MRPRLRAGPCWKWPGSGRQAPAARERRHSGAIAARERRHSIAAPHRRASGAAAVPKRRASASGTRAKWGRVELHATAGGQLPNGVALDNCPGQRPSERRRGGGRDPQGWTSRPAIRCGSETQARESACARSSAARGGSQRSSPEAQRGGVHRNRLWLVFLDPGPEKPGIETWREVASRNPDSDESISAHQLPPTHSRISRFGARFRPHTPPWQVVPEPREANPGRPARRHAAPHERVLLWPMHGRVGVLASSTACAESRRSCRQERHCGSPGADVDETRQSAPRCLRI